MVCAHSIEQGISLCLVRMGELAHGLGQLPELPEQPTIDATGEAQSV